MNKEYFQNKYRVSTIRLNYWNYAWSAMYYVAICTKDQICCMGEIRNRLIYLSDIGNVVFNCWCEIPNHFDDVKLDDWIVMSDNI